MILGRRDRPESLDRGGDGADLSSPTGDVPGTEGVQTHPNARLGTRGDGYGSGDNSFTRLNNEEKRNDETIGQGSSMEHAHLLGFAVTKHCSCLYDRNNSAEDMTAPGPHHQAQDP